MPLLSEDSNKRRQEYFELAHSEGHFDFLREVLFPVLPSKRRPTYSFSLFDISNYSTKHIVNHRGFTPV